MEPLPGAEMVPSDDQAPGGTQRMRLGGGPRGGWERQLHPWASVTLSSLLPARPRARLSPSPNLVPVSSPTPMPPLLPAQPHVPSRARTTSRAIPAACPVVPRGATPLPQHTDHPGGHQAGPAGRQGHHREAEGEEAGAYHLPAGPGTGQGDWYGRGAQAGELDAGTGGATTQPRGDREHGLWGQALRFGPPLCRVPAA